MEHTLIEQLTTFYKHDSNKYIMPYNILNINVDVVDEDLIIRWIFDYQSNKVVISEYIMKQNITFNYYIDIVKISCSNLHHIQLKDIKMADNYMLKLNIALDLGNPINYVSRGDLDIYMVSGKAVYGISNGYQRLIFVQYVKPIIEKTLFAMENRILKKIEEERKNAVRDILDFLCGYMDELKDSLQKSK